MKQKNKLNLFYLKSIKNILIIFFLLIISCSNTTKNKDQIIIKNYNYGLIKLPYSELLNVNPNYLYNSLNYTPCDSNNVALFFSNGIYYYSPVLVAQKAYESLSNYYKTNDQKYLTHTITCVETLRSKAIRYNGGINFPNYFEYTCNDISYPTPWFSGMSQGMLLSIYSRLYYLTNNTCFKSVADSILTTMEDFKSINSTVMISNKETLIQLTDEGYYWVDEYPNEKRRFVLNGSMIGALGLYDHWWVFGDEKSKRLFSQELTSIKDNILLYRNPGKLSSYDLRYKWSSESYHTLHISLLNMFYKTSGDFYFREVRDLFFADHPS